MSDGNFIKEGIPLRIGATRCVLGTLRIDPDTVEATNTTTDYENITGCSPRDPKHDIQTDNVDDKATSMACWTNYPALLPSSDEENPDTHLVVKARGDLVVDQEGEWYLPKIELTIRPLKSALDYKFARDFTDQMPVGSQLTWFGQEGLGTYAENSDEEMVVNDFKINYYYEFDPREPSLLEGDPESGYFEDDSYYLNELAKDANDRVYAQPLKATHGVTMTLKSDFYWKTEDKPSDTPAQYAPPLKPQEIDLTLYPRSEGDEPYEFKINESWDLRYRFPTWWNLRGGYPWTNPENRNEYIWNPPTELDGDNPFANEGNIFSGGIPPDGELLVPVQKFIRVGDPANFPIVVAGSDPREQVWGVRNLFALKQVESVTKIRKRYPFSFKANPLIDTVARVSRATVLDWTVPPNYSEIASPPFGESFLWSKGIAYDFYSVPYGAEDPDVHDAETMSSYYDCQTWWRMEINTDLGEWNYDEELEKGWKIKGKIVFGRKGLTGTVANHPLYHRGWRWTGEGQINPIGNSFNPQLIYNGIWRTQAFGFFEGEGDDPYNTAGEVEFEVEITEDNAIGSKVRVFDFPIGGTITPPWTNQPTQFGNLRTNEICFIKDFYITEIVPPVAD